MSTSDKLRQMRDLAPEQSDAIANSISQIEDQINELTEQADAIEAEIMDATLADLTSYLEITKLPDIETLYGAC